MSNVHILKDIKNKGHRLGSAYEQKLKKKIRTAIDFNSEIIDFNEKLQAENSEYSGRKKEFKQIHADIRNKVSQMNSLNTELIFKFTSERMTHTELEAEIKSLKSLIKILKREVTLV